MATHSRLLPGESNGQRNLVGYSPWGSKELDTTEHSRERRMDLQPKQAGIHLLCSTAPCCENLRRCCIQGTQHHAWPREALGKCQAQPQPQSPACATSRTSLHPAAFGPLAHPCLHCEVLQPQHALESITLSGPQ